MPLPERNRKPKAAALDFLFVTAAMSFTMLLVSCSVSMALYELVDIRVGKGEKKRHKTRVCILFDIFRRKTLHFLSLSGM